MARLGMLNGANGRLAKAEDWFKQATDDEAGRTKGWIWIMRGGNLAVSERFADAVACHLQATQLPGDPDEAYFNLGARKGVRNLSIDAEGAIG